MTRNTKIVLAVAGGVVLVLLAVRGLGVEDGWVCDNGKWVKHGNPTAAMPISGCETEKVNVSVSTTLPLTERFSDDGNISIITPGDDTSVTGAFIVSGRARVFENQFNITVESEGEKVFETTTMSNAANVEEFGNYTQNIILSDLVRGGKIILNVFDYSAKDGTISSLVTTTLNYIKTNTSTVNLQVFFGKSGGDNLTNCETVYPVKRQISADRILEVEAMKELLKGPTSKEKNSGYVSYINSASKLKNVWVSKGIATVNFSEKLDIGVAGSCLVTMIRSQITETMKQFFGVNSVVITVEGRGDNVLQP